MVGHFPHRKHQSRKRYSHRCTAEPGRLEEDGSQFVPALNQNGSDKEDRARSGIDISSPVMYVFTYALLLRADILGSWLNRVPRATGQAQRRRREPLDVP